MENLTIATIIKTFDMSQLIMSNIPDGKNGYDMFIEAMIDLKDNMTSPPDTILSRLVLGIIYIFFKTASNLYALFGIGIIYTIVITIAMYLIYVKGIKSYDYVQDLDLPSYTKQRRDLSNLTRRLRKIGKKLPPPFPNGWHCLVESKDLNVGDVKQVDCLGEHFAVFRTFDGKAHITDAHCPHLGANLAVGGTVSGNCIECPFHKWRFNSDSGKCVSIPNIQSVPNGLNIKVWSCSEVNGGVHVWYHAEGEPPQWYIPAIETIENGDWIYHSRNEFLVSSHVQDIPENGADVAHLNAVHSDHLMSGKVLPTSNFWNVLGLHEWNGKWEASDISHEARVTLTHDIKIFGKFSLITFDVTAKQIGPSYVQLNLKHKVGTVTIVQTITTLEPLLQKVVHRLYGPWFIRPLANFMMWGETVMFHRDVMIWNSKEFVNSPSLVKTDKCIKAFRTWFQQFYSANSVSFKDSLLGPTREILDW